MHGKSVLALVQVSADYINQVFWDENLINREVYPWQFSSILLGFFAFAYITVPCV